ncbi:DUF188 domain-containing protein [Bacillus cereus group sp. MYBK30-1]|uniref:DUF188 domain-containing protein n=1 Tax=unclassified Bacillus cereus group TaxID=2750818 RepID=UPI003F78B8A0
MQNISKILVDADACPVKDEIVQVGTKNLCRNFVCRIACSSFKKTARNWVYVDSEQDEVDFYIYQHAKVTDLMITQDVGLASLLVKKWSIGIVSKRYICNR